MKVPGFEDLILIDQKKMDLNNNRVLEYWHEKGNGYIKQDYYAGIGYHIQLNYGSNGKVESAIISNEKDDDVTYKKFFYNSRNLCDSIAEKEVKNDGEIPHEVYFAAIVLKYFPGTNLLMRVEYSARVEVDRKKNKWVTAKRNTDFTWE